MYECCPVCDLKFEREQGYFLGAMYVAYGIAVPILALLTLLVWLLTRWSLGGVLITGSLLLVPVTPFIFQYSRVLWLHMDYRVEPW